jgi:plastocyanin
MLTAGKPARLVFRNLDSELHAVVPKQFLSGVTVSVSGNGAPEFDEDGFKRVIIPSDGQVEIRFTPKRTGIYHYVCDMPGHEMRARIEVHE